MPFSYWEFSKDFVRLPQQFSLENQVVVTVYKRIRPTPAVTALRTLKAMQDYIGMQPGEQPGWMALSETPGYYIAKNRDDTYDIAMDLEQLKAPVTSFLYIDALPEQAVIAGEVSSSDPQCGNPSLLLTAIDATGRKISSAAFQSDTVEKSAFSISLETRNSTNLILNITEARRDNRSSSCWLNIHDLAITN